MSEIYYKIKRARLASKKAKGSNNGDPEAKQTRKLIILLVLCLLFALAAIPLAARLSARKWEVKRMMRSANSLELAFTVALGEMREENAPLYESQSENRLSAQAALRIEELTGIAPSDITVVIPPQKYSFPLKIVFSYGDYVAVYEKESRLWSIFGKVYSAESALKSEEDPLEFLK